MCIDSSVRADCKQLPRHPVAIFVASSLGITASALFCPQCKAKGPECGFTRQPQRAGGRTGLHLPTSMMAKDPTSMANPHSSCIKLSFSMRRSLSTASMDRSRLPSGREVEGAMSRRVRLLQPAPHPSGQPRAQAKLPGGSSLRHAPGSRGIWGNIARGHL